MYVKRPFVAHPRYVLEKNAHIWPFNQIFLKNIWDASGRWVHWYAGRTRADMACPFGDLNRENTDKGPIRLCRPVGVIAAGCVNKCSERVA